MVVFSYLVVVVKVLPSKAEVATPQKDRTLVVISNISPNEASIKLPL